MNAHSDLFDDVALYALGVLPEPQASTVREHLATCEECREEHRQVAPAVMSVAFSAQHDAPSPLLKQRLMQRVRREATPPPAARVAEMRAVRPIVWPAYALAAAFLIAALVTSIFNISLSARLQQAQRQVAQLGTHGTQLTRELAQQHLEVADLLSPYSARYPVAQGEVVKRGSRLYIAMNALPPPPKGKVYQAWTLHAGAKKMTPSVTFVPNPHGVAVVPVPVNATMIAAVAVSVEPDGGSKQPTSTPTFVVKLM